MIRAAAGTVAGVVSLVLALGATGCLPGPPLAARDDGPPLDPVAFFEGATRGFGVLQIRGARAEVVRVESSGIALPDGGFQLRQTIRRDDAEPTERTWTMARTGDGVWTGALSDADGTVTATSEGSALRIRYRMGRWTTMDQRLTLEPDGQAARNVATVRALGVPVARLVERIRRIGRSGDS